MFGNTRPWRRQSRCCDINEDSGRQAVSDIQAMGGEAVFSRTDVGRPEDVEALVDLAIRSYGKLDIAVNNAGIGGESGRPEAIALKDGTKSSKSISTAFFTACVLRSHACLRTAGDQSSIWPLYSAMSDLLIRRLMWRLNMASSV